MQPTLASSSSSPAASDAVFIRGLEFEGNHGYSAAERRGTRRFRVDAIVAMSLAVAGESDRLADTVDYYKVSELLLNLGTKSTYRLLEALASEMARSIQAMYPQATITIELEKLAPPCPGVPAACGVRIVRAPR